MNNHEYFTQDQAAAQVGKRVRAVADASGVPAGTMGRVIRADSAGRNRWVVAVEWSVPAGLRPLTGIDWNASGGQHSRMDWLDAGEYREYVAEIVDD